jgi:hypothetical protein
LKLIQTKKAFDIVSVLEVLDVNSCSCNQTEKHLFTTLMVNLGKGHWEYQLSIFGLAVPLNQEVSLSLQTLFEVMHRRTEILSMPSREYRYHTGSEKKCC